MIRKCENCDYCEPHKERESYGHCHRQAPTTSAATWPLVKVSTDWCGEFKAKENQGARTDS